VCSLRPDASVREALAVVVRPPLALEDGACIHLGVLVPDHARCAVHVRVRPPGGLPIDFVTTHLAAHPANEVMAERLIARLRERGALGARTILAGDLNAPPGGGAHAALTEVLRDARPGAPRTHALGGRIDQVLLGEGIDVVRAIDRRRSYERLVPAAGPVRSVECARAGSSGCPVSDHLPEAVVVRARPS
jgi:endonuclease/exonuclease/phosphatase family metal-dependent hydrolase